MHLLKFNVYCTILYCTTITGAFWAPELDLKEDDDGSKTLTLLYSVSEIDAREGGPNTCVGIARTATGLLEGFPNNLTWEEDVTGDTVVTCIIGSDYEEERSAIDPSVFWGMGDDDSNRLFMVTGGGFIIGTELNPETYGQLEGNWFEKGGEAWQELARGPISKSSSSSDDDTWVEAAYIHPNPKTGYYYMFVNWGTCCSGTDSTYQIRIGRSKNPMGPYLDKKGNNMMNGGGSLLEKGRGFLFGPGHTGIWKKHKGKKEYISFHYYDGRREGNSWIAEKPLKWKNGWPKTTKKALNTFPRNMLG